jgi:exoribonuclease R
MEVIRVEANEFEGRLRELSAMVANDAAQELFNQSYAELLLEVKALSGPRHAMFVKMKQVLMQQAAYLAGAWIREKVKAGPFMNVNVQ